MTAPILPTAAAPIAPARLAQIRKTAQQFEAIFVRQMLSAAHKSSFGETMTSSQGADTFRDMQDARFADIASQKGAFGLAKMIEKQLINQAHLNPPPSGEVAARRADGGGPSLRQGSPSVSLREPPPPRGEDLGPAPRTGG